MWGGDACVALAGGEAFTHETRTRATHNTSRPMRTNFRVERRTARTTQYWCKPLHRLDGPIRRIVGVIPCGQYHFKEETISLCHPEHSEGSPSSERSFAALRMTLLHRLRLTRNTSSLKWIVPCGRPGTGPRRNLPDVGSCRLDIYQSRCSWRWASLQLLYVGANRLPEKGPLVKYWYHVNGTAPATCAHHWKESVDGSSAPDKSRPVPTTAR